MANKVKVAFISALTKRLSALEIRIWQRTVVDNVRVAAHSAKLHKPALPKYLRVDAGVTLEMKQQPLYEMQHSAGRDEMLLHFPV